MIKEFWNTLSNAGRIGFLSGVLIILALSSWCGFWLIHTEYQVLFADLKPQDSAVMVAELDRLKIPYKIGDGGNAILVDKEIVHTTRFKLMGKDLPLHGAVGFELFNNSDFGMTEFAQKINYQRALQGEITRTIMSLDEVKDVRVHLAFPEEGLFKRNLSKAKAAINLSLRAGQKLRQEQILGIQRLVAAAVPGISSADVTIVDQQGVALTRLSTGQTEQDNVSGALDLKKDTEILLAKKVNLILDQSFGVGEVIASVDVILNMDQVRVTTEDVLSSPSVAGQVPTGVITREREVIRDAASPLDANKGAGGHGSNSQREVDYQVGRRIENIIGQPGSIRRIQAVAVVRRPMEAEQLERVKVLVAATIGANFERGDLVVVQSVPNLDGVEKNKNLSHLPALDTSSRTSGSDFVPTEVVKNETSKNNRLVIVLLGGCIFIVIMGFIMLMTWRQAKNATSVPLTPAQRERALKQIQIWMQAESNQTSEHGN